MFISKDKGFTLIELIVGVAVFSLITVTVYTAFTNVTNFMTVSRDRVIASGLSNELFEIIRNLSYADVGIVNGIPSGVLSHVQTFLRNNKTFIATTTVRNIDDPFDGTIGGDPNDLSPADYKLVEIEISCSNCFDFSPMFVNTHVAPRDLETASTNGALFVQVIDANGQPVSDASVHVENNEANPSIVIDDSTNTSGVLQIVDAPPGVNVYEIDVTKSGYTTDVTYTPGEPSNPNPLKPHATVALQQVTQITFTIDKISTIGVSSLTQTCAPVGFSDFSLTGTRLIGTNPDVLKFDENYTTDSLGQRTVSNLEWDTYNFSNLSSSYDLIGTNPVLPISLVPDSILSTQLILQAKNPRGLLVAVKDLGSQLPVSDASVRLGGPGYDTTLVTGRGFIIQTDWSGGAGQSTSTDPTRYFSSSNIDINNPAGELKLVESFGSYESNGNLISSNFDAGSPSNFHQISWQPTDQPPQTGPDSVKFQIATNNDGDTWNFLGPDGTVSSFYTTSDNNIHSIHNGDQFFRYQIYLGTLDDTYTPNVSDISFTFTSSCIPPGQVFFNGLSAGSYDLTITHSNYTTYTSEFNVSEDWQQQEAFLIPL